MATVAGVDDYIHPAQFGFRPKRGTADALMVVRRIIDAANVDNKSRLKGSRAQVYRFQVHRCRAQE